MAACPDCGGKMSGMADMCPHCGFMMKHKQVLKQKQRAKQLKKGRNRLLSGILYLAFGLIMSASSVSLLLCLIPIALGVFFLGRGLFTFIGFVQ